MKVGLDLNVHIAMASKCSFYLVICENILPMLAVCIKTQNYYLKKLKT